MHKSLKKNQEPNQHIMALVTFLALIPLVYFVPDFIGQFLPDIKWLNVVTAVGVIVPIISYLVVPLTQQVMTSKPAFDGHNCVSCAVNAER